MHDKNKQEEPLYETHGDHHAPFLENDELVGYFRDGIKNSVPIYKVLTDIKLDEDEYKSDVFSLKIGYPIDSIYYYALIAPDKEGKTNQFVSAYPYLPGRAIVVQILDILEWSNKLEATIKCKYEYDGEEFIFHFFATDYFAYKPIYKVGNRIEIALAASSGNAKVASKGFSFEVPEYVLNYYNYVYLEREEIDCLVSEIQNMNLFIKNQNVIELKKIKENGSNEDN